MIEKLVASGRQNAVDMLKYIILRFYDTDLCRSVVYFLFTCFEKPIVYSLNVGT